MAQWNKRLKEGALNEGILFGTSKAVQGDEWLGATPSILSQVNKIFPEENKFLGPEKTTLILEVLVKHFSVLFKSQHQIPLC